MTDISAERLAELIEQLRGRAAACGANHQVDAEIDTRAADALAAARARIGECAQDNVDLQTRLGEALQEYSEEHQLVLVLTRQRDEAQAELAGVTAGTHQIVPVEPTQEWLYDMGIERDDWKRYLAAAKEPVMFKQVEPLILSGYQLKNHDELHLAHRISNQYSNEMWHTLNRDEAIALRDWLNAALGDESGAMREALEYAGACLSWDDSWGRRPKDWQHIATEKIKAALAGDGQERRK